MKKIEGYIPEDSALNRPAMETRDENRVSQYTQFFDEHFYEDGRPRTLHGRIISERNDPYYVARSHPFIMEADTESKKEDLEYQLEVIERRLRDATHAVDQMKHLINKYIKVSQK